MALNLWQKLKKALHRTRSLLGDRIRTLFKGAIDEEALEELEQLLYEADLGVKTTAELIDAVKDRFRQKEGADGEAVITILKHKLLEILAEIPHPHPPTDFPRVILIVGVNGNGKTTTVAKLAKRWRNEGKELLIAAADTYRAAAIQQLESWADRVGAQFVKGKRGGDPAAVTYDALSAAKNCGSSVIIVDTAGRLHTKRDLMEELKKIQCTCAKQIPGSPHETFLVLDATIGQNAIDQAQVFHQFTPLTGLILTKMDGTAKGGIAIHIQRELKIPIRFIGTGEQLEDLEPFDPEAFVEALFH